MSNNSSNLVTSLLEEAMKKLHLTQEDLSLIVGKSQPIISDILNGKRLLSPELSVDMERALQGEVDAHDLLVKQSAILVERAKKETATLEVSLKSRIQNEFPLAEMVKRGWIPKLKDSQKILSEVLSFANGSLDLDDLNQPFDSPVLARQSQTLGYLSPSSKSSRAWLYRVKELAEMTPVKEFDHTIFVSEGLTELRTLVRDSKDVAKVPQTLARYGVRLVIVEHLPKTKLEGAAMWLDGDKMQSPVVALTLRFGHLDKFWHNLAHELHHLKYNHDFSADVNSEAPEEGLESIEDEANEGAANWLISTSRLNSFISRNQGNFTERNISAFSEMVAVHPSILVGQLQNRGVVSHSSRLNKFKIDIRKQVLLAAMADGFKLPVAKRKTQTQ